MIKAVWDAIIVQVDEKTEKMHGKFIIPDLSQEKAIIGTIIDVGPGRWNAAGDARIPMSFSVGQKVVLLIAIVESSRGIPINSTLPIISFVGALNLIVITLSLISHLTGSTSPLR